MEHFDFLVVGGGAAGTTAAGLLRALNPDSSVGILCEENWEFYSRVLLPKYIRGEIGREQVFLKDQAWYKTSKIDLILNAKAKGLNGADKTVVCENGEVYGYGKLLIAVGARAIKLNAQGSNLKNISYMWTIDDAESVMAAEGGAQKGVVVGGGFIGLEFVHSFRQKNIETTIIEGAPTYWGSRLRQNSSEAIKNMLLANGVRVVTGEMVEKFESKDDGQRVGQVVCKSGQKFDCDLVGIGIGIKSDLGWLDGSGMEVSKEGVMTNEFLETNLPDVYAAGDCVSFLDTVFETQHNVSTWANATTQGAVVAKTMSGTKTPFEAVSSYTINFFGGSCSFVGITDESFADEVLERGSAKSGKITEIFIKEIGGVKRIVGAIIVNGANEVIAFSGLIKNKANIGGREENLKDLDFDLSGLV